MLLEKFYELIDRSPIGKAVDFRKKLIEQTDPNRIYVENIRSFFHIPFGVAKQLCDQAVIEGAFEERTGLLCPRHQSLIGDVGHRVALPDRLICAACELEGEPHFEYTPGECRKITFYKTVKNG